MNCLLWLFLGVSHAEDGSRQGSTGIKAETAEHLNQNYTEDGSPKIKEPFSTAEKKAKLEQEILSPGPSEITIAEKDSTGSLSLWVVILGLFAILGFGAFLSRKRKPSTKSIRVISRSYLGRDGSLAVVEMLDGSENKRRFLIGLNANGAPRMMADLSPTVGFPDLDVPKPSKRVNIVVGDDPIQNGKELLSEVLSERESASIQTYNEKSKQSSGRKNIVVGEDPDDGTDPWLKGIEKALGKNG